MQSRAARATAADDAINRRATLRATAVARRDEFFETAAATARRASETLSARVGSLSLTVTLAPTGVVSVRARTGGYVLVVPDLGRDATDMPGLYVTTQIDGRGGKRWFPFASDGKQLVVNKDGVDLSADAFIGTLLEPWVRSFAEHEGMR